MLEEETLRGVDACEEEDDTLGVCDTLPEDEDEGGFAPPRILPVVDALLLAPLTFVRTDPLALVAEFLRDRTLPVEFTDVVLPAASDLA